MHHHNKRKFTPTIFAGVLTLLTIMSGLLLSAPRSFADSSAAVNINLTVEAACALTVTSGSNLSTIIRPGDDGLIGATGLKAACNDPGGLAIYAIGYTGDIHGDNNLRLEESGNTLSSTNLIPTGAAASPTNSQWNMTVAADTSAQSTFTPTIPAEFQDTHIVPTTQAQIASYPSTTDQTTGVNIKVTYNAHISVSQAAGTYKGKVKYTLVHPSLHAAPASRPATLDTGETVNTKLKFLAAGSSKTIWDTDNLIKAIDVHTGTAAPSGFTPSESNTVSSSASEQPIYIVFDNANDAGIMHFYTEGDRIVLSAVSSYMFNNMRALSEFSDITDWDTSRVTDMYGMFYQAGSDATTFSLDLSDWDVSKVTSTDDMFYSAGYNSTTFSLDVSGWDTSSITNMTTMFCNAGHNATTWSIDGLSGWDVSRATSLYQVFAYAGYNATTFSLDVSDWNTSQITNTAFMFTEAGYNATTFSLDVSGWNTSQVESMSAMFENAGHSATTWSINGLSGWNTSHAKNMSTMFSYAGYSASNFSLDISSWNISQATNISSMFQHAGHDSTAFSLDLSGWNTSAVTNIYGLFSNAGYNATTFSLNLSGWNTSNVTNMSAMFYQTGYNTTAANWIVTIPQTNGGGINNTASRIYGQTTSKYVSAPSGKSFTLAQ